MDRYSRKARVNHAKRARSIAVVRAAGVVGIGISLVVPIAASNRQRCYMDELFRHPNKIASVLSERGVEFFDR